MLVATYFFLIDGARMVQSITKLSPLKQDYEEALIDEFVTISRAVVVATLLSALAQGVLSRNRVLDRRNELCMDVDRCGDTLGSRTVYWRSERMAALCGVPDRLWRPSIMGCVLVDLGGWARIIG